MLPGSYAGPIPLDDVQLPVQVEVLLVQVSDVLLVFEAFVDHLLLVEAAFESLLLHVYLILQKARVHRRLLADLRKLAGAPVP